MIKYNTGLLGLKFILRITGSVFPKALLMAVPNAVAVLLLHRYARYGEDPEHYMAMDGVEFLWAGYTSVLSFLLVFRNNQAYTRFWEGATLIHQIRGEWFSAVSGLCAFCNKAEHLMEQVEMFQHTLVRLASLLHCSALQQICDLDDDSLGVIGLQGIHADSLAFMHDSNDRCEVIMQWIQRLIVEANNAGTLNIAAPILSRCFQEFSRGMVNLKSARKIKEIPFPFPYAQLITSMLLVHWVATPVIASQVITSFVVATAVCFFVTFVLWCLVFIVMEIDQPFGEDPNDLPIREMQKDFNRSLLTLMHRLAQTVPVCTRDLQGVSRVSVPVVTTPSGQRAAELALQSTQMQYAQEVEDMMDACAMKTPGLRQSDKKTRSIKELGPNVAPSNSRWYALKAQISKPSSPAHGSGRRRPSIDSQSEDSHGRASDREIRRQSEDFRGLPSDREFIPQSPESATTAPGSDAREPGIGGGDKSHGQLKPAILGRTLFRGRSSQQESARAAPRNDAEEDPGSAAGGGGGSARQPMSYTSENSGGQEILAAHSPATSGEALAALGQEARRHSLQIHSDLRPVMYSF